MQEQPELELEQGLELEHCEGPRSELELPSCYH